MNDFIKICENLTQILKNWKKEGIALDSNYKIDDNGATFYITNQEITNEENINQEDSDELKEEKTFGELFSKLKLGCME
ncbi:MAG: hypothetical protein ACTSWX_11395 [Promethearchaeota archaeon]